MKRLRNALGYLLLALVMLLFFAPKRQLWYLAEDALKPYGVVLSGEYVSDNGFSLSLENGTLYYDDLKIATLGEVDVTPLLVYNAVTVAPFTFADDMQAFLPGEVEEMKLSYSLVDPVRVHLKAEGEFGSLTGLVNLMHRDGNLTLSPSPELLAKKPLWLKELKKQASGAYTYEVAY